jgi:hypothetical protein
LAAFGCFLLVVAVCWVTDSDKKPGFFEVMGLFLQILGAFSVKIERPFFLRSVIGLYRLHNLFNRVFALPACVTPPQPAARAVSAPT